MTYRTAPNQRRDMPSVWRAQWAQYLSPARCDEAEAALRAIWDRDRSYAPSVLGQALLYRLAAHQPLDVALAAITAQTRGSGR